MMHMTANDCGMMMGAMGWAMPVIGIALLTLLGLGIASLAKFLFTSR
ncbi:hypothetical protein [Halomonas borealis]|jgi:hypothetical protein|nr:hypothetical protein [Halomonas borealis]